MTDPGRPGNHDPIIEKPDGDGPLMPDPDGTHPLVIRMNVPPRQEPEGEFMVWNYWEYHIVNGAKVPLPGTATAVAWIQRPDPKVPWRRNDVITGAFRTTPLSGFGTTFVEFNAVCLINSIEVGRAKPRTVAV